MNAITKQLIMTFGPMLLKSIIDSMLNEEKLKEYRDEILKFLREKAGNSKTAIDDALVGSVIGWVMEPGHHIPFTQEFCSMARRYITDTENEWDDMAFLPIIDRIEQIGVGK